MKAIDLKNLTIKKAHAALATGEYSSVDLTKAYLEEIKKKDKEIHAYLEVYDNVLDQAAFADKAIAEARKAKKDFPLLMGIPVALKDNILVKGKIASSASKILENYTATYDATVIEKLQREHGAVLIGRTNMDEFAMGGSTENSAYGPTKNPLDMSRVPGGSSGGSAAAVAADMALVALGSDTGGSIRQPASFCGIVGLKPTYGAVSRFGLMAMGSSLDQIGTFGKNAEDTQILFEAIKGKDPMDSTSEESKSATHKAKGIKKIGVPREFLKMGGIDKDILKNFEESLEKLKKLGYEIVDVALPNLKYSLAVYYVIVPAEVSSNMARFDGMRYGERVSGKTGIEDYFLSRQKGLGREVKRRIILGTYVLSSGYYDAYYNKANFVREVIKEDFKKAFEKVDCITFPTTPSVAFKLGEKANDPLAMYLEDIFTVPVNLVGVPAVSVPSGVKKIEGKQMPIGLQLIGNYFGEDTLFSIAKDFLGEK